jgi:hypothetical protein
MDPRTLTQDLERDRRAPWGSEERFRGYGVAGLPFSSGHVLAFRRVTASSIGPPYTTIWHRDPTGAWTFYTDEEPNRSCPRYFGRAVKEIVRGEIELSWEGPWECSLRVPEARLQWGVRLSRDGWTRTISLVGSLVPEGIWQNPQALRALGVVGTRTLGLGKLALSGQVPSGHSFKVCPERLWRVEATAAILGFEDLGPMGPLPEQANLGDFWIPNGGMFVTGEARFSLRQEGSGAVELGRTVGVDPPEEKFVREDMRPERRHVS